MKVYAVETVRNEDSSIVEYASSLAIFYRTKEQAEAFIQEYEQSEPDWQTDKEKFHHIVSEVEVNSPFCLRPYEQECNLFGQAISEAMDDLLKISSTRFHACITGIAIAFAKELYDSHKNDKGLLSDILRHDLELMVYEIKRQYIKLAEAECEEA